MLIVIKKQDEETRAQETSGDASACAGSSGASVSEEANSGRAADRHQHAFKNRSGHQ